MLSLFFNRYLALSLPKLDLVMRIFLTIIKVIYHVMYSEVDVHACQWRAVNSSERGEAANPSIGGLGACPRRKFLKL